MNCNGRCLPFIIGMLMVSVTSPMAQITVDTSIEIPKEIAVETIGDVEYKAAITDKKGLHLTLLTKKTGTSGVDGEIDFIRLFANQFLLDGKKWKKEWVIQDHVDCQGVDIDGDFFSNMISFTDLDSNNIIETSVAYSLICAGGVEPKTIKVIMRQGTMKYGVRGESLVKIDEKTSYGGTFKSDEQLDTIPAFKLFLVGLWKRTAGVE